MPSTPRTSRRPIPLLIPLTLFVSGGLLAAATSYDPMLSFTWARWLLVGFALYCGVVVIARLPRRQHIVAGALVAVGTAEALKLMTQYRYLVPESKLGPVTQLGLLLSGPFPRLVDGPANLNFTATTLEITLPVAVGLALAARGRARLLLIALTLLIGLALVLTVSRGAWLALLVGALLSMLALHRRWQAQVAQQPGASDRPWLLDSRRLLGLALIGASVIIGTLALEGPEIQRTTDAVLARAADRLVLYRNSFFLALDFPLTGIGGGETFAEVYARFQLLIGVPFLYYAHNLLLGIWLAQGIVGLLGFFALALGALRLFWRAIPALDMPGLGAIIGCAVLLLHGLTDAPQYLDGGLLPAQFALFGLAVAAATRADSRPLAWIAPGGRRSLALGVGFAALIALAGPSLLGRAGANLASVEHARARLAPGLSGGQRRAALIQAMAWADRALQIAPGSPAALKARGMIALDGEDYPAAIAALERALPAYPGDQATAKGLGYAYIWGGEPERGVPFLQRLDRAGEVRGELDVWQVAWAERNRPDLAARARDAAREFDRRVALGYKP